MRPGCLHLAVLAAACGATQRPAERPARDDVVAIVEVRLPADPYTPLAQVMPVLHEVGGRICGRRYRVVNRRWDHSIASEPVYIPAARVVRPRFHQAYEIIATIECLAIRR
jgi:hypothetical protein